MMDDDDDNDVGSAPITGWPHSPQQGTNCVRQKQFLIRMRGMSSLIILSNASVSYYCYCATKKVCKIETKIMTSITQSTPPEIKTFLCVGGSL